MRSKRLLQRGLIHVFRATVLYVAVFTLVDGAGIGAMHFATVGGLLCNAAIGAGTFLLTGVLVYGALFGWHLRRRRYSLLLHIIALSVTISLSLALALNWPRVGQDVIRCNGGLRLASDCI